MNHLVVKCCSSKIFAEYWNFIVDAFDKQELEPGFRIGIRIEINVKKFRTGIEVGIVFFLKFHKEIELETKLDHRFENH